MSPTRALLGTSPTRTIKPGKQDFLNHCDDAMATEELLKTPFILALAAHNDSISVMIKLSVNF